MEQRVRPLTWIGSSLDDLRGFPERVREHVGFALYQAQLGLKHSDAKPLAGLGPGVLEVVSDLRSDTWRAVYTVRFREAVYVLHAFQKKARKGIATPKADVDLIRRRLKAAEEQHAATYGRTTRR